MTWLELAPGGEVVPVALPQAEEELFVVLDGAGHAAARRRARTRCARARRVAPRRHAFAHQFIARRRGHDDPRLRQHRAQRHRFYPDSNKVKLRGLGVIDARRARGLLGRRGLSRARRRSCSSSRARAASGKSTVAAALGIVAARRGLRTIVAEVAARDDVTRALGRGTLGPRTTSARSRPACTTSRSTRRRALEEYLRDQLPARRSATCSLESRMFTVLRRGDARACASC